jgi:hypothetical protein
MYKHTINVSKIKDELIKLNLLLNFDIDPLNNNKDGLIIGNRLIKGETIFRLSFLKDGQSIAVYDYKNKKELFSALKSLYLCFKFYDQKFKRGQ